jgi:alanine racemase
MTELLSFLGQVQKQGISVLGFSSHLACGESDPSEFSSEQTLKFQKWIGALKKKWGELNEGIFPKFFMFSNSLGLNWKLLEEETCSRPGLLSYGVFPDESSKKTMIENCNPLSRLKPVASLKVPLRQMHELGVGQKVSYGLTYECKTDKTLAVLSYGYADGLRRSLSVATDEDSKLHFWIEEEACPIVGRVTMDMVVVDLTKHSQLEEIWRRYNAGEDVWATWIGEKQTAEWHASTLGTISYEILCNVGSRVKREYLV